MDEVLEDLEPLAEGKNIRLIGKCKDITMVGSDILIYRLVYNLVENAIKYNHSGGQVTVTADRKENMCICQWRIREPESLRNLRSACSNRFSGWINPEAGSLVE